MQILMPGETVILGMVREFIFSNIEIGKWGLRY